MNNKCGITRELKDKKYRGGYSGVVQLDKNDTTQGPKHGENCKGEGTGGGSGGMQKSQVTVKRYKTKKGNEGKKIVPSNV